MQNRKQKQTSNSNNKKIMYKEEKNDANIK